MLSGIWEIRKRKKKGGDVEVFTLLLFPVWEKGTLLPPTTIHNTMLSARNKEERQTGFSSL